MAGLRPRPLPGAARRGWCALRSKSAGFAIPAFWKPCAKCLGTSSCQTSSTRPCLRRPSAADRRRVRPSRSHTSSRSMLEHLALQPTDRVLEIGTGSGYVTALLSTLCAEVYSVERHAEPCGGSASDVVTLELFQRESSHRRRHARVGRSKLPSTRFWSQRRLPRFRIALVRAARRGRTHDCAGRPVREPGIAVDSQGERVCRSGGHGGLPVCAAGEAIPWLVIRWLVAWRRSSTPITYHQPLLYNVLWPSSKI